MKAVLVRGIGDIGSAVAHRLHREGYTVLVHDIAVPPWPRRKMAFTDAIFDGAASLCDVSAIRCDQLAALKDLFRENRIAVSTHAFEAMLRTFRPDVLVDARMRKRQMPERQVHLAQLTIGLGPNFVAPDTTHLVIETAWGDSLGAVIAHGAAAPLAGAPRLLGGYGLERVVYASVSGIFTSDFALGDEVTAGQVVAHVGTRPLAAPLPGRLRGLTRHGVPVMAGTKVLEIDPRGNEAVISGIGERPAIIARGVVRALSQSF